MNQHLIDKNLILNKLGIKSFNDMQIQSHDSILKNQNTLILSATGSGKTLAFLIPLIESLNPDISDIQALIIAPSRELAIQIDQVLRSIGSGYKTNVVYGGRKGAKDKEEMKQLPSILIGTPGRLADRIRRDGFSLDHIKMLVIDEFDKALEIGFENEMIEILDQLKEVDKKVMTSATYKQSIPDYVNFSNYKELNFLNESKSKLEILKIPCGNESKFDVLFDFICHIGSQQGIVFCNFKDSINELSEFLNYKHISHSCFYGGMEQKDRERALIKFRNGTNKLLIATDLAARGIDVPEINFILHFEIPQRKEEFIHRNGRTARMHKDGTAYVVIETKDRVPDFIGKPKSFNIQTASIPEKSPWATLYISGGRKDKISKGDVVGLFMKKGDLQNNEIGRIEILHDCCFVAIHESKTHRIIESLNNSRLKKKKIRISTC